MAKTKTELIEDIDNLRDEVEALEDENVDLIAELEEVAGEDDDDENEEDDLDEGDDEDDE
jgi:hypothetical protein